MVMSAHPVPLISVARLTFCALSWGMLVGALCLFTGSCSAILDLEPDCVPADCNGYQCNAEKTGCLSFCIDDTDCSDNHLCDDQACNPTGCVALHEPFAVFEDVGDPRNLAVAGADESNDVVLAVRAFPGGLSASVLSGSDLKKTAELLLDPGPSFPAHPSVSWNGQGWGIVWRAIVEVQGKTQQVLRFAAVNTQGQLTVPTRDVWTTTENQLTGEVEKSIDHPDLSWHPATARYMVVWTTRFDTNDLLFLPLTPEGGDIQGSNTIAHESARRLTRTPQDSIFPQISARNDTIYDVVYREGNDAVLRSVDLNGTRQGTDINLSNTQTQVTSLAFSPLTTGVVAGFHEANGNGEAFRIQLQRDRSIAGGQKFSIDRNFSAVSEAFAVSTGREEYAVVIAATQQNQDRLFLARYMVNGARISAPFAVESGSFGSPTHARVAPLSDGYAIFFQDAEDNGAGNFYGVRWACQ